MTTQTARKRGRKPKLTEAQRAEVRRLYREEQSLSVLEIAHRFGVSHQTIYTTVNKENAGALRRSPASTTPPTETLAAEVLEKDTTRSRAYRRIDGDNP